MAARKPLFMSADGYSEEMAIADTATFGGLTLGGNIAMGGFKVTGLADGTAATDAVNLQQLQQYAYGLDWKNSVKLATAAALPAVTAAGSGVGKTLTANAVGILTVDGVATVLGDSILVKNQVAGADNGIYTVTTEGTAGVAFVLTRRTDADSNAEVTEGLAVFASQGTVNADSGWTLTTNDPITVDTTALAFSQFSSVVAYTFDQGLLNTAGSITVELDAAANAQGAGAGGGSSGLEFDANTAAGKLRAAVNATGGLERSASGLAAKLNGTTLQSAAGGLSVKGLPSLFEINAVAVGATVTAANLDTLTNGSNADALHVHAAVAATEAPKVENTYAVVEAVAVADPLYQSTTANQVGKARADTDAKAYAIGIARTAQAVIGNNTEMVSHGIAAGVLSGATAGQQYYLAAAGGVATSSPAAGNRVISMGFAVNATDLWVRITDFGKKAA